MLTGLSNMNMKKNYKYSYINEIACCEDMDAHLTCYIGKVVLYNPSSNTYSIKSYPINDEEPNLVYYIMKYCLWCGEKLPNFITKRIEILEKEYGLKCYYDFDEEDFEIGIKTRIPEEFKTDEWWKKRGIKGLKQYWKVK